MVKSMPMMSLTDNKLQSPNAKSEVKMDTNFPKIETLFCGVNILPTVISVHINHVWEEGITLSVLYGLTSSED